MKPTIYWIEGPWCGQLAIIPRPRGGDWLEDEVRSLRAAGIDAIVSALTKDEVDELDLSQEAMLCQAQGVEYFTFPIVDRGIPTSVHATVDLVRQLEAKLSEGKRVAVHCRAGIGRSAILATCLLVFAGLGAGEAFDKVKVARGCSVPDTEEQRAWVARFAAEAFASTMVKEKTPQSYLSAALKKTLEARVRAVPTDLHAAFEKAFDTWKATWFSGGLMMSSDPGTRAVGPAFDDLIALGPQIIPLVVEKLADPENFMALQLYDAIQPDSRLVVHVPPDDEHILEGEQGRARRVVQLWLTNQ